MKQLFHLCSTWQQQQWGKGVSGYLCLFSFTEQLLQPFPQPPSSCLGNNQSGVAEAWRGEMYSGGVVGNYKRNQFNEFLPPWKNVYKSGMWPDPNNNLLRACLPRHNAAESKVRLSNTAAFVLNLFLFSLNHFSAPTTTQSCRFFFPQPDLTVISLSLAWHCDAFSFLIRK